MALTDIKIKGLKPKEKRYSVTDDRGLSLEVYPTGGMAWRFRYRLNGKLEKLTLGKYPALSLKNARLLRDEAASKVALGKSPVKEKKQTKIANSEATTLEQFGNRFMKEIVLRDRKNIKPTDRYLRNNIYPAIGSKLVKDITVDDVRSIIWLKKENGFPAAAAQIRSILKRMFDYALTCGLVSSNPVLALPMRHVFKPKSRDRVLTPDEMKAFLKVVYESNIRRQFKLAYHLILLTMVRKCELMFARWEDIHLDISEWHIPAGNSKTGKPHIVYLSKQAAAAFSELKVLSGGSEWVLPSRSSLKVPFTERVLNAALKGLMKGMDIPRFTIHDFRRTASTTLHEQGWASDVVEKALNHTIKGVRGVYNRAEYSEQRKKMLQSWGDFVEGLLDSSNLVFGRFVRAA